MKGWEGSYDTGGGMFLFRQLEDGKLDFME